ATPCTGSDRRRTPTPPRAAAGRLPKRRVWPSRVCYLSAGSGLLWGGIALVTLVVMRRRGVALLRLPAGHVLTGGVLHLVDMLGVPALGALVDEVAGLLDGGVGLVRVLPQPVLHLVQEAHELLPSLDRRSLSRAAHPRYKRACSAGDRRATAATSTTAGSLPAFCPVPTRRPRSPRRRSPRCRTRWR